MSLLPGKYHLSKAFLFVLLFLISVFISHDGICADFVVDAATFYSDSIKSDITGTYSAGATQVSVANGAVFTAGQDVLLFNTAGTYIGQYETNVISSVSSNTLTLQNPLSRSYTADAQVIAFTEYDSVQVINTGTITCSGWNNNLGGVVYIKAGALLVDATSTITASSKGYLNKTGPGAGSTTGSSYGGGGGGAYGGDGSNGNYSSGGAGYGSVTNPVNMGSGGGDSTYNYSYPGAYGGGIVLLDIAGTLTIFGSIRSDGASATGGGYHSQCGGGGAGGTVNITAGTIEGSGVISADGGNRSSTYNGGAGGGGRIAVNCTAYNYAGTYSSAGGDGYGGYGGAGTIFLNNNGERTLTIHNNTSAGRDLTNITSAIPSDIEHYVVYNANVQLASGAVVTGDVTLNGNLVFYNNASITPSLFTVTGSSNQIYNNSTGYILFASFNYANTYFKNDGHITIQDKHLQVPSGTTFVLTHPLTDSDYDLTVKNGG
ncbi:MAG: hypothetical protein AB1454_13290, partial [Candidatus Auribacterota bacterium]